jgi:hypothetical protein
MSNLNVVAAFAAGLLLLSSTDRAVAQQPSATGQAPDSSPSATETGPNNGTSNDSETHAVLRITSVEVMRSTHAPSLDVIRVRGLASSAGWEEAELIPLTRGVPADGILHLILVARPPEAAAEATGYEIVEAIFPLESGHPFKGINVHAATNALSVSSLPGYSESKSALQDCGKCVGKRFISKGGSGSAARGELVREEQMPPETRIVRPSDGIPSADSNPNRLTLILDKDDRILTAVWE